MSTFAPANRIADVSPRSRARTAGVFYLLTILTGVGALVTSGRIVVSGDAAATAANILANEAEFRLAVVGDLIAGVCYVVITVLLYGLFRPVDRSLSLLAAFFSLMGCTIGAVSRALYLAPLVVLGGAKVSSTFDAGELQTLAYLSLRLGEQVSSVAFVFFGLYCLLIGYLIFRSSFLPQVLGVLMAIAGLCWLTGSFASFLSPPFARLINPYLVAGGLGEAALTLWLLVKGVDEERWKEQAVAGEWRLSPASAVPLLQ
jgi:hypothetical protein